MMKRIGKLLKYEFLDRASMCFLITFVFGFFAVAGVFNYRGDILNGLNGINFIAMFTPTLIGLAFGIKLFLDLTGEKSQRILSLPMKLKKYIMVRFLADTLMMVVASSYGIIISGIIGLFMGKVDTIFNLEHFLVYSLSMTMSLAIIYASVLLVRLFVKKRIWCMIGVIAVYSILEWQVNVVLSFINDIKGFDVVQEVSAGKATAINGFLEGTGGVILNLFNGVKWNGSHFVFGTLVIGAQIVLIGLILVLGTAFLEKKFEV